MGQENPDFIYRLKKQPNIFDKPNIQQNVIVNVEGINIKVPAIYEDLSAAMFFFPANYSKTKLIVPGNVKPIKIAPNTCLLGITIFDYTKGPVGAYREIAISLPATVNHKYSLPIVPFLYEKFNVNVGYYTTLLATDTSLGKKHSEQVFGYPVFQRKIDVDIRDDEDQYQVNSWDRNSEILSLLTRKPKKFRKLRGKRYNTFFVNKQSMWRVDMGVNAVYTSSFFNKFYECRFGDHEISNSYIKNLLTSNKLIKFVYYKRATEILSSPTLL